MVRRTPGIPEGIGGVRARPLNYGLADTVSELKKIFASCFWHVDVTTWWGRDCITTLSERWKSGTSSTVMRMRSGLTLSSIPALA
jgi:hypothetical protein